MVIKCILENENENGLIQACDAEADVDEEEFLLGTLI
jgi:hypothetical protein